VRALRRLKLRPIATEIELATDLHIVELPGHTPGSIGLLAGQHLLTGDAVRSAKAAVTGGEPQEADSVK
jgi:N-acyl homoserine lactone hydrolase